MVLFLFVVIFYIDATNATGRRLLEKGIKQRIEISLAVKNRIFHSGDFLFVDYKLATRNSKFTVQYQIISFSIDYS